MPTLPQSVRKLSKYWNLNWLTDRQPVKGWVEKQQLPIVFLVFMTSAIFAYRLFLIIKRIYFQAHYFSIYPIDGAFQLFDPLRRLSKGQIPGVDFPFFHGLGTLIVHYPLFHLFGGNLYASELSREIISPLFFMVASGLLLYVTTRKWLAVVTGLGVLLLFFPMMDDLVISSNSLLGVRSTVPLLVASGVILGLRWREKPKLYWPTHIITMVLLGASFFVSDEQGVAAVASYLVVGLVFDTLAWQRKLVRYGIDLAIALVSILILFVASSGSHFMEPIVYALKTVPADQFWYYGAPPNEFISSFRSLFGNLFLMTNVGIALIFLIIFIRLKKANLSAERFGYIYLFIYGLITTISILGIENAAYLQPLIRIILLTLIGFGYLWLADSAVKDPGMFALPVFGVAVILAMINITVPDELQSGVNPSNFSAGTTLGVHLNKHWQAYMKVMDQTVPRNASLWSTYVSIPEALMGISNPAGFDYIIHALGPADRQKYADTFVKTKPDYVTTVRADFTNYETWLQMESWSWYEWLVVNYTPTALTPHSVVWKRNGNWQNPNDIPWTSVKIDKAGNAKLSNLPTNLPGDTLLTVQVTYQATNKLHFLPVLGDLPRYLINVGGSFDSLPVSLPPYEHTWTFPIAVQAGSTPTLSPQVANLLRGARLKITSVKYRVLPTDPTTVQTLYAQNLPAFIPDN